MDLLDFEGEELYFDEPLDEKVIALIKSSSEEYGEEESDSELNLLRAYLFAPESLTVLVALYRYYYYKHRLEDSLVIAHKALSITGERLNFPESWQNLTSDHVNNYAGNGMGLVRFYLFTLKGASFLHLRMHQFEKSREMLEKLSELDTNNRLGIKDLLELARNPVEDPEEESV